jgi:hypothetical protein
LSTYGKDDGNMRIAKELYEALHLKYKHEILDARARLRIYFENPVAIGEHPQHTEEMDKLLEKMAGAEDKKEILERQFKDEYNK